MTESNPAAYSPPPVYSTGTTSIGITGPQPNAVPGWLKVATIACLGLAGILYLLPQFQYVGEEYHIFMDYYEYHNLGTQGAGAASIIIVSVLLIAAIASVWTIDQPDQPLGRVNWLSLPLVLIAIGFVIGGSKPEDSLPLVDDRNWTAFYWDYTSQHTLVWIGLGAGLLGAIVSLFYARNYRPAPSPAPAPAVTVVTMPYPPQMAPPPPPLRVAELPTEVPNRSTLEQKLDDYDKLRAADKITDEEHAALRKRALTEH